MIASSECGLSINIPAGALKAETTIGIEPITRTNIAGAGKSFRLSPHDVQFEKPVSLTYAFSVETDSIAMMETFGFSYQLASGAWKYVGASSYDLQGKTVTFKNDAFQ